MSDSLRRLITLGDRLVAQTMASSYAAWKGDPSAYDETADREELEHLIPDAVRTLGDPTTGSLLLRLRGSDFETFHQVWQDVKPTIETAIILGKADDHDDQDGESLTETQIKIQRVLSLNDADEVNKRMSAESIAAEVYGAQFDANSVKQPLAEMVRRGILGSKGGRGGGYWLARKR